MSGDATDARRGRDGEQSQGRARQKRSAAEWTTLALSLAVIGLLVGLVSYTYLDEDYREVLIDIQPRLDEIRHEQDRFYLPVEVTNLGERTAEDVRVRFSLVDSDRQPQITELTIGFLPGNGTESGVLVFGSDPATATLTVESISYIEP